MTEVVDVGSQWRVWWLMAYQDIASRYRRSFLGPFWISASMGAFILAIALLYSQILGTDFKDYLSWIAPGLLVWNLLHSLITEGANSVVEHEAQLKNLPFPLPAISARVVMRNLIIFFHNALVVILIMLWLGNPLTGLALLAVPGVVILCGVGYFISLALGPISARFRDIPQVLASVLQVAFFLTPVIWKPGDGRSVDQLVVLLNPFHHLIELVRAPLQNRHVETESFIAATIILFVSIVLAFVSVSMSRRRVGLWV